MARVLCIGDTHEPFTHKHYLDFCRRIRDKHKCDTVVHIGDEVDNHAISFHEHDPDGWSPGHEAEAALAKLRAWYKTFPRCHVCIGNHGARHFRVAFKAGLSKRFIRDYAEAWDAPEGWTWKDEWTIDGVLYTHGIGSSGKYAHVLRAEACRQSVVMGHLHTGAGVQYLASSHDLIFGMNVGCGLDLDAYAMAYSKPFPRRPVLGCGVVIDGIEAVFEPMLFKNHRINRPVVAVPKGKP